MEHGTIRQHTTAAVLNLMFWAVLSVVLGLALDHVDVGWEIDYGLGTYNFNAGTIIMLCLMLATAFSLNGFDFGKLKGIDRKTIVDALMLSFIVNTGITLLIAALVYLLSEDAAIGFAMVAAMPAAVSVITGAMISGNNQETAVSAVACTYIAGLVLTPLISFLALGNAVNPFQVLLYIVLFIIIPVALSLLIKRLNLHRNVRMMIVNIFMAVMIFFSINGNRDPILADVVVAVLITAVAAVRIAILHVVSKWYVFKAKIDKDSRTTFLVLGVWKTTGLATAMCMAMLADHPFAIVVCAASVLVEDLWFPLVANRGAALFEKKSKTA